MPKLNDLKSRCLRVKAAATYMGVSPGKLRDIVQKGELHIVNYGENVPWLLDKLELDRWIDGHKTSFG